MEPAQTVQRTALAHGARESLALTFTATNANGSSQVKARIPRLRARD